MSCQPEKPNVAEILVLVSKGSRARSILQVPSSLIGVLRLVNPETEEVNESHTEPGFTSSAPTDSSLFAGIFSRDKVPSMTVRAPAPAIGALIAFGATCSIMESSVTLT